MKRWGMVKRGWSRAAGLALVASLSFAARGGAQDPGKPKDVPAGPPAAPAPPAPASGDISEADRLAAALKLKSERKIEEALPLLESLARASRLPQGALDRATNDLPLDLDEREGRRTQVPSAVGVLAELEAIDARLRLGRLDGLPERVRRLLHDWGAHPEVRRRARALGGLIPLRTGPLLEPNAISRVDLGKQFKERFHPGREDASDLKVPLDQPIRHLSRLLSGKPGRAAPRAASAAVSLVGFLEMADLSSDRMRAWRTVFEGFDRDPRVLIALFIFTGGAEPPAPLAGEEPWSRAVVFWIRGTPSALSSAVIRSRFEWIAGPTFFLLEPGGKVRSWKWPEEGWEGFMNHDLPGALAGGPAMAEDPAGHEPGAAREEDPASGAVAPARPAVAPGVAPGVPGSR
jgi:hypothetical protein